MAQIKVLLDEFGVIYDACKNMPEDNLKVSFLGALAELEDNECHRRKSFPKTRLRRVRNVKQQIYRADVTKRSGWRIHVQYGKDGRLHLKDILPPEKHDAPGKAIKAKKERYK